MADDETELNTRQTAWVRGATNTAMGHATLTDLRLVFYRQKFMAGVTGGALGAAISASLGQRSEAGGPLLVVPLDTLTGWRREKKLLSKDRIVLTTAADTFTFSDGWKDWTPLLRGALAARHGRNVTEVGTDSWQVAPG